MITENSQNHTLFMTKPAKTPFTLWGGTYLYTYSPCKGVPPFPGPGYVMGDRMIVASTANCGVTLKISSMFHYRALIITESLVTFKRKFNDIL